VVSPPPPPPHCHFRYNFYRRKTCEYNHLIQPSATGRTDLNITLVVAAQHGSGTADAVLVTVTDPLGRTCATVTLPSLADGESVLLELSELECVFDGCPPLITLDATGPDVVRFAAASVVDSLGQTLLLVPAWGHQLALLAPEAKKDNIHTRLELPILQRQEALDIECVTTPTGDWAAFAARPMVPYGCCCVFLAAYRAYTMCLATPPPPQVPSS